MLITVICNHSSYNFCSVQQCTEEGPWTETISPISFGLFCFRSAFNSEGSQTQTFTLAAIKDCSRSAEDVAFDQKPRLLAYATRLLPTRLSFKPLLSVICTPIERVLLK